MLRLGLGRGSGLVLVALGVGGVKEKTGLVEPSRETWMMALGMVRQRARK